MNAVVLGLDAGVRLLEELECSDVDGAVREHANKTKSKTAVCGAEATIGPHLLGGFEKKCVALETALNRLTLETELESVDGIDTELGGHATHATGNELGDRTDLSGISVSLIGRKESLGSFIRAELNNVSTLSC